MKKKLLLLLSLLTIITAGLFTIYTISDSDPTDESQQIKPTITKILPTNTPQPKPFKFQLTNYEYSGNVGPHNYTISLPMNISYTQEPQSITFEQDDKKILEISIEMEGYSFPKKDYDVVEVSKDLYRVNKNENHHTYHNTFEPKGNCYSYIDEEITEGCLTDVIRFKNTIVLATCFDSNQLETCDQMMISFMEKD